MKLLPARRTGEWVLLLSAQCTGEWVPLHRKAEGGHDWTSKLAASCKLVSANARLGHVKVDPGVKIYNFCCQGMH